MRILGLSLVSLFAIACSAQAPVETCTPAGTETRMYRLEKLHLPADDGSFAGTFADGDRARNRLGAIVQVLRANEVDLQIVVDELLARDGWPVTLTITSTDPKQLNATGAEVTLRHGTDDSSSVCGTLIGGNYQSLSPARTVEPSTVTLPWPFFGETPISLSAAHVTLRPSLRGGVEGEIHGAITVAELDRAVLPQIAALLTAKVNGDPSSPFSQQVARMLDDGNCDDARAGDGVIAPCEVRSSVGGNLLLPDLDLVDAEGVWAPRAASPLAERDAISFGVAFEAVPR
jgi:hypothetical protein